MGLVIDLIDKRRLTLSQLVVNIGFLVLAALAMYGLRFVWRRYIFGTANKLARILRYRLFKHLYAHVTVFLSALSDRGSHGPCY